MKTSAKATPTLGRSDTGLIPGRANPKVADDTAINAKIGEFVVPQEVVSHLGADYFNKIVTAIRKKIGVPQVTGPKKHNQTDHMGRMDSPTLGMAAGGEIKEWRPPYETSPVEIAKANPIKSVLTLGAAPLLGTVGGFVGNVVSAMGADTDPMAMVKSRTQDVAGQLGTTARNLSQPAAAAVQAITGQPIVGNPPVPKPAPVIAPPPALGVQTTASVPQPAATPAPIGKADPTLGSGYQINVNGNNGPINTSDMRTRTDWSDGSTNMQNLAIESRNQEVLGKADRLDVALAKNYANRSLDEHINTMRDNLPMGTSGAAIKQFATDSYTAQEKRNALQLGDTTTQRGQDIALEGVKTTATEAAEARKAVAEQAAQARVLAAREAAQARAFAAREAAQAKQSQRQDKQDESDKKDIHDIITNGYGVAPTPQAIQAYRAHQSSLVAWDNNTTKMLAAHTKANPKDGTAIKSALIEYHRNPTNEDAIKGVEKARALLTGDGAGVEPDWFMKALQMPRFDTAGMQAWKQPGKQPGPLLGAI